MTHIEVMNERNNYGANILTAVR